MNLEVSVAGKSRLEDKKRNSLTGAILFENYFEVLDCIWEATFCAERMAFPTEIPSREGPTKKSPG
jgi:hypothetical protein